MAFWKKAGYVAGVTSGILPVFWMGRFTLRASRAMVPPMQLGSVPRAEGGVASEPAARFVRAVAAQGLTPADLDHAQRRAQWRMHLSALAAAVLLVYGALHPVAWTFLPLSMISWIYGRYQSICIARRELPLFWSWLIRPFHGVRWWRRDGE